MTGGRFSKYEYLAIGIRIYIRKEGYQSNRIVQCSSATWRQLSTGFPFRIPGINERLSLGM